MTNDFKVYFIRDQQGKIWYCGLTKDTLKMRFNAHVSHKQLDRSQYFIDLVKDNLTQFEAAQLERHLIKYHELTKLGWNKSLGSIDGSSQIHSLEQRRKWSKERNGKPVSPEHAAKNRISRIGMKNTEYQKRRMFEVKSRAVKCLNNNAIYFNAKIAAEALGVARSSISTICNGKKKSVKGLRFEFVNETAESSRNDLIVEQKFNDNR